MRSGWRGLAGVGVEVEDVEDAADGRGGWKDCGGYFIPIISKSTAQK
jgi:hypothetical protein